MVWRKAGRAVVLALGWLGIIANGLCASAEPAVSGSVLLGTSQQEATDQLVPLGSVKEGRDGRALPERSERVAGHLQQTLYQLPSELNIKESQKLLDTIFNALQANDHLLYRCEGRECGQSNLWANDVFGQSLLFGNDRTQFAMIFASEDLLTLTMLYGSERPNRRSHYIVQTLTLARPWTLDLPAKIQVDTQRWAVSITRTVKGTIDLKRAKFSLNPVITELVKRPTQNWAIVAHTCEPLPAMQAFANSQEMLTALAPLLQISGKVFHPLNLGNVYTTPCSSGKNVEIIELRP